MARPLGIGIIGLGAGAEPHLKSLADLTVKASAKIGATPSMARAQARQASLPFPVTTDVQAVINHADVEAVIIVTPPNTHRDLTLACLNAGKHVLVEKPLEITAARGHEMADLAARLDLRLGVMLQHHMRPGALRLKEILAADELGDILSASAIVNWWRPQAYYDEPGRGTRARDGGGVLLTQAIHTLDLFRALVGFSGVDAAQVSTTAVHRMETEDQVHALLRLGNNAPGVVIASTAAFPGQPERIEIFGTRGSAALIGGALTVRRMDGAEEHVEAEGRTGSGASIMDFPHDAHRAIIADFCDAVRERRDPAVPAREALASQRMIEAILARAGAGQ